VELRQSRAASDRYGRILAHAYVIGDGLSAAHEMLGRGFARVAAQADCAIDLLAREQAARNARLGLWGQAYYAVVAAENPGELAAERGHLRLRVRGFIEERNGPRIEAMHPGQIEIAER